MARLLVVSRSMALAMRLADAHEVIEYPVDQVTQLAPGDDIDAIVLDLGEPSVAIQALDRLRGSGYTTGVLMVSGYQPSWAGLVAIDLPAVVVVPLPITKAALLHGVDELTRGRPNRAPAPPPRGWNGPRPTFVPAPPPPTTAAPTPAVAPPAPAPSGGTSWTALLAPSWGSAVPPVVDAPAVPAVDHDPAPYSAAASAVSSPRLEADREAETDDESYDVTADLTDRTDPESLAPPVAEPPTMVSPDTIAPAPAMSAPFAPAPFAPAPWALHQGSADQRSGTPAALTAYQGEPVDHGALMHHSGDRLRVESPVVLTGFERPPGDPGPFAPGADDPAPAEAEAAGPEGAEPEARGPLTTEPDAVEPDVVEPDVVEPDAVEPDVVEQESIGRVLDLDALALDGGWTAQDFDWWRPLPDDAADESVEAGAGDLATADAPDATATPADDSVWESDVVPPETPTPPPLPVRVRSAAPAIPPPFDAFPASDVDDGTAPDRDEAPTPEGAAGIDTSLFEPTDDVWRRQLAAAEAAARDRGEFVTPGSADAWAISEAATTVAPEAEPLGAGHLLRSAQEVSESIAARRALLGRPDLVAAPSLLSRRLAGRTPSTNGLFAAAPPPGGADHSLFAPAPVTPGEGPAAPTAPATTTRAAAPPPSLESPASLESPPAEEPAKVPSPPPAPIRVPVSHEPLPEPNAGEVDDLPASALIAALVHRVGDLYGVSDTAQVLADEIVDRVRAEAVAVVVADGDRWRVTGGIGLRPMERRLSLPADHWLIAEVADDGRAVLIDDTDAIRPSLAGAPLAAWHYLLAVPVPGHEAVVVLARGPQAEPFGTGDVALVAPAVREAAQLLRTALQTRALARRLASLRDLDPPTP